MEQNKKYKSYYDMQHVKLYFSCTDGKYIEITKELVKKVDNTNIILESCIIAILNGNISVLILLRDKLSLLLDRELLDLVGYANNQKIEQLLANIYEDNGYDMSIWNKRMCGKLGMNNLWLLKNLIQKDHNIAETDIDDAFLRSCHNTDIKTLLFLNEHYDINIRMYDDVAFLGACRTGNYEIANVLSSLCKNYVITTIPENASKSYYKTKLDVGQTILFYKIV